MNNLLPTALVALVGIGAIDWALTPAYAPPKEAPPAAESHAPAHPEARPFDAHADAMAAVDAALARASRRGTHVLLVMGANWCHDSRGLAGLFETPDMASLIEEHFELVYVDAGRPREEDVHNLHVARRFGVERLEGTPNLFILSAEGELLNPPEDVIGWTDAASRDPGDIRDFLLAHRLR
ncbi:thioredoxin family protein [Sphingomicrobium lutaoense]|uniref:Protein-disulfide isomerase n=1 Tax=Sphingomicrobium lutaoense TaxID=515949 RepID=A0A839Z7N5_9SPHN|nr:thioredoxin family protein [Sphingomicrobium lutaoense]MBB3764884.1 hypothetical protein [Sphingomicrobium lutaoense]